MREDCGQGTWLAEVGIEDARGLWNLSDAALYEEAIRRAEGVIARGGPLRLPARARNLPCSRVF